ncbi:Tetratricopeptide repeat-containing protein [Mesonia phycicola]|uniref:histidine kinase n=1 Tax=Mesonia phycicola TaxID=579105 RepID=A0A1M6BT02_9FLAO|nr:response regulator [Mesonia phycicola]SHI51902.1 Tetratricopeptide repeat-containing protein [Mesonia phycicola]
MRNLFFLILIFLTSVQLVGQQTSQQQESLQYYFQKSTSHYKNSSYLEALIDSRILLKKAIRQNDSTYISKAYFLLGSIDQSIKNFEKAENNYSKAIGIAKVNKDSIVLIDIYQQLARIAAIHKNFSKSEVYYQKALKYSDALSEEAHKQILVKFCQNFLNNKSPQKVTPYLNSLNSYLQESSNTIQEKKFQIKLNYVLGRYYGEIKNYNLAQYHLSQAYALAKRDGLLYKFINILKFRARYYKNDHDFENALIYKEEYIDYKEKELDSISSERLKLEVLKQNINKYEAALDTLEKETVASVLVSKSKLSLFFVIISGLLGVSFILIFITNQKRKKLIFHLNNKNKELVEAQEKVKLAAEIKSNFISNISHEIRTPLHGVIGITSLLLAEKEISNDNRKLLKSLKFSGDYLLGLINNVLLMSKLDNNNVEINLQPIKIKNLIDTIKGGVVFLAKKNNVNIEFKIQEDVPEEVILDSNIVSEILINLIENAIKFSKGGLVVTSIEINNSYQITQDELMLRFTVKDNGIGIPEDKKKVIFNKFSQVGLERNMLEGTGIGLSLVKNLLLHLDSDIQLDSTVGKGSTFYFDLSCSVVSHNKIDLSLKADSFNFSGSSKKILLVEDNRINKMVIEKYLSPYNIQLDMIEDGLEAYNTLLTTKYDLLLLDINIPSMNGYEITKKLREKGITIPIVAVTASELSEIQEKAYSLGVDEIIIKPFQKQKLIYILSKFFKA